jgi:hypothetical protein
MFQNHTILQNPAYRSVDVILSGLIVRAGMGMNNAFKIIVRKAERKKSHRRLMSKL